VTFTARAAPGPVAALSRDSGEAQTGTVGTVLPAALLVQALDRYGNVVPGVTVNWAVTTGGGSVAPAASVSDTLGRARAQWTLGTAQGVQTATASVGGALTVTFSATATVPAASVTVAPAVDTIPSGATVQLTATPRDSGGNPLTGKTVTWAVSDTAIATVNDSGLVTAHQVGSAAITATVDGVHGTASVTVTPGPAATATSQVSASAPTVLEGGTVTFTLKARDAAGNALDKGGLTVAFTTSGGTSAGTIGPVSDLANGSYSATFTATAAGTPITIGATIGGQAVTSTLPTVQVVRDTVVATVSVAPTPVTIASGATQQLTASPKNAAGITLTGKRVTWSSGTPGVASVDTNGLVTGALVGTATITATVQGVPGNASVTVTPGAPSTSRSFITLAVSTVTVGDSVSLMLTTVDAAGNALTAGGHAVTFTQSGGTGAGTVGAVTDHGDGTYTAMFTATVAGTPVSIGATIDGQTVTSSGPPPTLQVNPGTTYLVHWINPAGGQWSTAANWNPARVPTAQDTAVVDEPGVYAVTNAGTGVGGLWVGAATGPGGARVRFDGPATIPGAVLVRSGDTLDVNEVVIVGSFQNDGVIVLENNGGGEYNVALAIDTVGVRTAENYGTIEAATGSVLNVTNAPGLVNHGTLSPGTNATGYIDQMPISGNVTFSTGSVVRIQINGAISGQYDVLGVGGTATLGDTLRVQLGYSPAVGDVFFPVIWTGYSGTFGTLALPALTIGQWQASYTPVGLQLSVVGPTLSAYQGDGQTTFVDSLVAVAPAVRLLDAASNPIAGTPVTFAVASGGGSIVGLATVNTDASGIAQVGGWQLGPTPGSNTLTATASGTGITGNPVTFTATGIAPSLTWTGAISTDWSNPGNWSPAAVPSAGYAVSIGPAANQPALTGSSAANGITISGAGARLTIGGQTLSAAGLNVTNNGLLVMTNTSDVVAISGGVFFDGGNESGSLTAGQLRVGGDFNENVDYSSSSFAASGTHTVVLTGGALQQVTFVDLTGASSFQNLDISPSAGMNIQFDFNGLVVKGTLTSQPAGATPMLYGLGRSLTASRLQVSGLVVDDAPLILNEGGVISTEQIDNVTFQGFRLNNGTAPARQLTFVGLGDTPTARTLTFNNLTFTPLVSGDTGSYIAARSLANSLIINLVGYNVSNGPAFTTTVGTVTVNWQ